MNKQMHLLIGTTPFLASILSLSDMHPMLTPLEQTTQAQSHPPSIRPIFIDNGVGPLKELISRMS